MTEFSALSDREIEALKKLWAEPDDSDPDDGTKTLIHMRYLATIDALRGERDLLLAELEAREDVIRRLGFALQSAQAVKESLEDQIERLRVERDEARAELESLKRRPD